MAEGRYTVVRDSRVFYTVSEDGAYREEWEDNDESRVSFDTVEGTYHCGRHSYGCGCVEAVKEHRRLHGAH